MAIVYWVMFCLSQSYNSVGLKKMCFSGYANTWWLPNNTTGPKHHYTAWERDRPHIATYYASKTSTHTPHWTWWERQLPFLWLVDTATGAHAALRDQCLKRPAFNCKGQWSHTPLISVCFTYISNELNVYNFTTEHHHSWSSHKGIFIINYDGILLTAPLYLIIVTVVTGRKVRLFHFLFEMLENLGMAHCISWVPAAADGVFRFSSRNKEQVAALWGQRKGNRRPMTYQKMSRALRNYARSGEIFKVKKKMTYQFSRVTLSALRKCHQGKL